MRGENGMRGTDGMRRRMGGLRGNGWGDAIKCSGPM